MNPRNCEICGVPLDDKRSDAHWCSDACRMKSKRRQRARAWVHDRLGGSSSPEPGVRSTETYDADDRFHRMLAQESSTRERDRQATEWLAYERRHGTPHPDRVRAQIERQAAEDTARQPKFTVPSLSERGQAERGRAPLTAQDDPGWPLSDDELDNRLPSMVDMPAGWRSGRNPFYR